MDIAISLSDSIEAEEVIALYQANHWSSAEKPVQLVNALRNSHGLVTARLDSVLVGVGNAISDGYLVVYYPHLLVHPEYQSKGIGRLMMSALSEKYRGFHQQMLTSDGDAVEFYKRLGFKIAGKTIPMWVYEGTEH